MRSPRSRRSVAVPEAPTLTPAMEAILQRVDQLSDLDLRKELSARQFSCGPIVGTTRSVYKKKLIDMLIEEEAPSDMAKAASSEEDDDEEDDQEEVERVQIRHVNGVRKSTPKLPTVENEEEEEEEVDDDAEEEANNEDEDVEELGSSQEESSQLEEEEDESDAQEDAAVLRQRVPGQSVETKTSVAYVSEDGKTVKRTTTTTTRVLRTSDIRADGDSLLSSSQSAQVEEEPKPKKKSSCLSLLLQLIVILVIFVFVYVIVVGPSSPLALPAATSPHDVENPPINDGYD